MRISTAAQALFDCDVPTGSIHSWSVRREFGVVHMSSPRR
jgi:hypothetical protein